jgi:hypothetical protein
MFLALSGIFGSWLMSDESLRRLVAAAGYAAFAAVFYADVLEPRGTRLRLGATSLFLAAALDELIRARWTSVLRAVLFLAPTIALVSAFILLSGALKLRRQRRLPS